MKSSTLALALLGGWAALQGSASAATLQRFALVVGANHGGSDRPALPYATSDAERLPRVLVDLGRVTAGQLRDVEASGAARLELGGLEVDRLEVRLSGAAIASASGTVEQAELQVSGASRFNGGDLDTRVLAAGITGASYALVRASDSLVASVSGVSVLEYIGDPVVVPTVSGASVLRRVGP